MLKIRQVSIERTDRTLSVLDSDVGRGLRQGGHFTPPDIDSDIQSDRRQEIREYLEQRYNTDGRQRVFSAGTFSTLKLKAAIKDVARVHRVSHGLVNYITAIFEDDNMTWTDLFRLAARNAKVRRFVNDYPQVVEDIQGIMGQPRAASIHASAVIVTPAEKDGCPAECFDFLPIRKMDGLLVSELDGYSVEEIGLLKEDILATKELSKLGAVIGDVNREYGTHYTLEDIARHELRDEKTYRLLADGYTQNVFQFSSRGITKFIMDVQPDCIEDLVVINALYRPATLDVGATEEYVRYKRGEVTPVYGFGTYEATKNTYGLMTYQEQFMSIAHTLGGFDLGKTDVLRKAIGKKNPELMASLKDDFIAGAITNGCPDDEAREIWHKIETAGGYSFNRCISGRERIYRPKCGRWQPTIAQMYRLMNSVQYARETGHLPLRNKYLSYGYGVAFSLNEKQRLVKNRIKDICFAGYKAVYRITLEDGRKLDVTANHKHPTQRGMLRTDQLIVGEDRMFVNAGRSKIDSDFRFTDKGRGNDPEYHDPGLSKWGEKGLDTALVTVTSVTYLGEEEVYDVEMEAPHHTFLTGEGVVTCNSHAAAYALTAYAGAWLKANYATAFYTVALQWADDTQIATLMSEMEQCSTARIVPPDINRSAVQFYTDYRSDSIYWSLSRIRMVGVKTAEYIVRERERCGNFTSIEEFIRRIFRRRFHKLRTWEDEETPASEGRVPVNARHVKHLILAGCFDALERIDAVDERYGLLQRAATELGFALDEREFDPQQIDKHYFWTRLQIAVSGIGSIDYRRIFDSSAARQQVKGRTSYMSLREAAVLENEGKRIAVCATVTQVEELSYKDKTTGDRVAFCKIVLQQNTDTMELVCWNDFYSAHRSEIAALKYRIVIVSAVIKYSDYAGVNTLNTYKTSILSQTE
nr:MAG TPA: DNA polymerase III, alpha subunit [Caudoviricetes sp.]